MIDAIKITGNITSDESNGHFIAKCNEIPIVINSGSLEGIKDNLISSATKYLNALLISDSLEFYSKATLLLVEVVDHKASKLKLFDDNSIFVAYITGKTVNDLRESINTASKNIFEPLDEVHKFEEKISFLEDKILCIEKKLDNCVSYRYVVIGIIVLLIQWLIIVFHV